MADVLNFGGFYNYVKNTDEIHVQSIDRDGETITIERMEDTPPLIVAEMFVLAHDCGLYDGPFDAERDSGSIIFHT